MGAIRSLSRAAYKFSKCAIVSATLLAGFGMVRTLYESATTEKAEISSSEILTGLVNSSEEEGIESKIRSVLKEDIEFTQAYGNKRFEKQLYGFIFERRGDIRWRHWSLEEKINFAREFSSSLNGNSGANLVAQVSNSEGVLEGIAGAVSSIVESSKLDSMDVDELVDYDKIVCAHYSKVFANALNLINLRSGNPEDIHVGTVGYSTNAREHHGDPIDAMLFFANSVYFGEYNNSVPHVINIVATENRVYLIDAQYGAYEDDMNRVVFHPDEFEIKRP